MAALVETDVVQKYTARLLRQIKRHSARDICLSRLPCHLVGSPRRSNVNAIFGKATRKQSIVVWSLIEINRDRSGLVRAGIEAQRILPVGQQGNPVKDLDSPRFGDRRPVNRCA